MLDARIGRAQYRIAYWDTLDRRSHWRRQYLQHRKRREMDPHIAGSLCAARGQRTGFLPKRAEVAWNICAASILRVRGEKINFWHFLLGGVRAFHGAFLSILWVLAPSWKTSQRQQVFFIYINGSKCCWTKRWKAKFPQLPLAKQVERDSFTWKESQKIQVELFAICADRWQKNNWISLMAFCYAFTKACDKHKLIY